MRFALTILAMLLLGAGRVTAQQLDESWTVSVNGQTVRVSPDGDFSIRNIAAPDLFGPGGPGTAPDNLSDDAYRLTGSAVIDGVTYYVYSDCFRIASGQTLEILPAELTFTETPPALIESLISAPASATLTAISQTTTMQMSGVLANGSVIPLNPGDSCPTFRTSNRNVARVDSQGVVTAVGAGTALLATTMDGATTVSSVTVALGDPLTDIVGVVQRADGTPASGAAITLPGVGGSTTTGPNGTFSINGVATSLGPITAVAQISIEGTPHYGRSTPSEPLPGGYTDAGIITLGEGDPVIWVSASSGSWQTGSNWSTGSPPGVGQTAIISVPQAITVTYTSATTTIQGVESTEDLVMASGTLTINGASYLTNLTHNNGIVTGAGSITIAGNFAWNGGTQSGSGALNAEGGVTIGGGSAPKFLVTRTLNNSGLATFSGTGGLRFDTGAIWNNLAGSTFEIQNNAAIIEVLAPIGVFNNFGTLRKTSAGTSAFNVPLNNSGEVACQIGTLSVTGGGVNTGIFSVAAAGSIELGGTYAMNAGASLSGAGFVTVGIAGGGTTTFTDAPIGAGNLLITGATAHFNGTCSVGNLTFQSGTLSGPGSLTINGLFNWSSGTVTDSGILNANGGVTILGTSQQLRFRTLNNAGLATIADTDSLSLGNGATWNNLAGSTMELQGDGHFSGGFAPIGTFNNSGTLRKINAGTSINTIPITNTGVLESQGGTFEFRGSLIQSSGNMLLGGGSITKTNGPIQINGGTIGLASGTSSGAITGTLAGVTLANAAAATVPRPGAAGVLTVSGPYTQSAGTLAIELGGLTQDTQYDRLAVTGNATLGGTLELTLINGFVPNVGDQFQVLSTTGTRSGTFSTVNPTNFPVGLGVSVTYSSNAVTVTIVSNG